MSGQTEVSILDIKRNERVLLANGWEAEVIGSTKGFTTLCNVHGWEEELGSVYTTDIECVKRDGEWLKVKHTPGQVKNAAKRQKAGW